MADRHTANAGTRRVVLIGGGHTHALVLHAFREAPLEGAEVTVINPGPTAPYSGMLPGFVAGHYPRAALDIDLAALCDDVGARFVDGRAVAIDPDARRITLEDGQVLAYDLASVDVGITSDMIGLPGFAQYGVPAKPLGPFANRWDAFRDNPHPDGVAIIGGGIAGAELSMAMAHALPDQTPVTLIDRSHILSANSPTAQRHVRRALQAHGVTVREGAGVRMLDANGVHLEDGSYIKAGLVVGAAGATPHPWLHDTGLDLTDGFVTVGPSLQSSDPAVFAVGDCAHMAFDPRPKAGVYAVRQAPVLTANLRAAVAGAQLQSYTPQRDYLKLVSLGGKRAFGEKAGIGLSGHWVWRLKDKIDCDFMRQFR